MRDWLHSLQKRNENFKRLVLQRIANENNDRHMNHDLMLYIIFQINSNTITFENWK